MWGIFIFTHVFCCWKIWRQYRIARRNHNDEFNNGILIWIPKLQSGMSQKMSNRFPVGYFWGRKTTDNNLKPFGNETIFLVKYWILFYKWNVEQTKHPCTQFSCRIFQVNASKFMNASEYILNHAWYYFKLNIICVSQTN